MGNLIDFFSQYLDSDMIYIFLDLLLNYAIGINMSTDIG